MTATTLPRYYVVEGSASGHCCIEASVLVRGTPIYEGGPDSQICECFSKEEADQVAAALNAPSELNTQMLARAVEGWKAEVEHRPLINVHRRFLDAMWRKLVIRFGGDAEALLGLDHDALRGYAPMPMHKASPGSDPVLPSPPDDQVTAALATLLDLGYEWNGGEKWRPPLGPKPAWLEAESCVSELDPDLPITKSLLEAACRQLRQYVLPNGGDDQVVLNLEAAIRGKS